MVLKRLKYRKIVCADHKNIDKLNDETDKVLSILGFKEALVTDESTVGNFCNSDKNKYLSQINNKFKKYGFKVSENDYIWKIAKKLRGKI